MLVRTPSSGRRHTASDSEGLKDGLRRWDAYDVHSCCSWGDKRVMRTNMNPLYECSVRACQTSMRPRHRECSLQGLVHVAHAVHYNHGVKSVQPSGESLWLYAFKRVAYSWPLCANITSYTCTKLQVYNVRQHLQKRTEPRPYLTSKENLLKIGRVNPEICMQTDKRADKQWRSSQYFAPIYRRRCIPEYQLVSCRIKLCY